MCDHLWHASGRPGQMKLAQLAAFYLRIGRDEMARRHAVIREEDAVARLTAPDGA
jgi:hypothetical protein